MTTLELMSREQVSDRVCAIKASWNRAERVRRKAEGDRRLNELASMLGLQLEEKSPRVLQSAS